MYKKLNIIYDISIKFQSLLLFPLFICFWLTDCNGQNNQLGSDIQAEENDSIPFYKKEIIVGVDNAGDENPELSHLIAPMQKLGLDFLVYHYAPPKNLEQQKQSIIELAELFDKNRMEFVLNTELCNNFEEYKDQGGWDWCKGPNDTHRFTFRPEILMLANKYKSFKGVMYDEPAHMQINRNWIHVGTTKIDMPFLGETTGKTFEEADNLVYTNAKIMVDEIKGHNTPYVLTEHVFPVLFHNYARAGMTISYKLLKESWAPVWAACAMGAAIQYSNELWSCLDLWFAGVPGNSPMYPGHSPEDLKNNLIYSYWMGNNRVYVENLNYEGSLYHLENGKVVLNDYGKAVRWYTHEYLPQNSRGYTFKDLKPEIAIIRFDDTDFGIANKNGFPDQLFGSRTLKSTPQTRQWMTIWNLISHGVIPTPENGISWLSYPLGTPYKSFAPVNNVVVFDQNVEKKHLQSLKLAFLTGLIISTETLASLEELVKTNGLTVVTTPTLAPANIKAQYSGTGTSIVNQGNTNGCWIITDNFLDPIVKNGIKPILGKDDEMRYVFGNEEVIMKIGAKQELTVARKALK